MSGNLLLIYNPLAGHGKALGKLHEVRSFLEKQGKTVYIRESPVEKEVDCPDWLSYETIVVCGGDGTLHRIINYWGIPAAPVALLRLGSGNDFARETTGPGNFGQQLQNILNGSSAAVDVGICNGVYFCTGIGIGFDGLVAARLSRQRLLRGHAAYFYTVLRYLFAYKEAYLEIEAGEKRLKDHFFMATAGNTAAFGGGFRVLPLAHPSDGLLDLCLIKRVTYLQRMIHLDKVKTGKHLDLPFVEYLKTGNIKISAAEPLPCHMDGECYQWKDFDIKIAEKALEIRVSRP